MLRQDTDLKADPALPSFWPSIAAASAQLCNRERSGSTGRKASTTHLNAWKIVTRRERSLR
jgi:hypothetical protein